MTKEKYLFLKIGCLGIAICMVMAIYYTTKDIFYAIGSTLFVCILIFSILSIMYGSSKEEVDKKD